MDGSTIGPRNVTVNGAYLLTIFVVAAFLLIGFMLPSVGGMFGFSLLSKYAILSLFIPAAVLTGLFEIYKAITGFGIKRKHKEKKYKKAR
jgi:hypothetical protein